MPVRALLVTKGHPFEREPFFAAFDAAAALGDIEFTHAEQPAAMQLLHPDRAAAFDVIVHYDMPGVKFSAEGPRFAEPPEAVTEGWRALLDDGIGVVALHHAIAAWPTWPEYHDWLGGYFLYQAARVGGTDFPDSGYAMDVDYTASVIAPDHPICAGLPATFDLNDELYLGPVFDSTFTPLITAGWDFDSSQFASADAAIHGRPHDPATWQHPAGKSAVAWVKQARNSPLAYLQFGHGPATYANENFRLLLANAVNWAAQEVKTGAAA